MLHAKVMTVDGHIANVGSANLNSRSMALDEEINMVVLDDDVAATLDHHFEDDLERSVRIEPGRWSFRSRWQQGVETAVRPLRRFF
jgi:cardiolipin synthase